MGHLLNEFALVDEKRSQFEALEVGEPDDQLQMLRLKFDSALVGIPAVRKKERSSQSMETVPPSFTPHSLEIGVAANFQFFQVRHRRLQQRLE